MTTRIVTDSTAYLPERSSSSTASRSSRSTSSSAGGTTSRAGTSRPRRSPRRCASTPSSRRRARRRRSSPRPTSGWPTRARRPSCRSTCRRRCRAPSRRPRLAAAEAPVPVEVVDSETIGMAMGFAVVAAAESAAGGADLPRSSSVRALAARPSGVLFYVDTLEHLRRGGRIGAASALLGSALAIKPILAVRGGRIVPVEKVRTSSRAVARIEAMVARAGRQGRARRRHRRPPPRRRGAGRADRGAAPGAPARVARGPRRRARGRRRRARRARHRRHRGVAAPGRAAARIGPSPGEVAGS